MGIHTLLYMDALRATSHRARLQPDLDPLAEDGIFTLMNPVWSHQEKPLGYNPFQTGTLRARKKFNLHVIIYIKLSETQCPLWWFTQSSFFIEALNSSWRKSNEHLPGHRKKGRSLNNKIFDNVWPTPTITNCSSNLRAIEVAVKGLASLTASIASFISFIGSPVVAWCRSLMSRALIDVDILRGNLCPVWVFLSSPTWLMLFQITAWSRIFWIKVGTEYWTSATFNHCVDLCFNVHQTVIIFGAMSHIWLETHRFGLLRPTEVHSCNLLKVTFCNIAQAFLITRRAHSHFILGICSDR